MIRVACIEAMLEGPGQGLPSWLVLLRYVPRTRLATYRLMNWSCHYVCTEGTAECHVMSWFVLLGSKCAVPCLVICCACCACALYKLPVVPNHHATMS